MCVCRFRRVAHFAFRGWLTDSLTHSLTHTRTNRVGSSSGYCCLLCGPSWSAFLFFIWVIMTHFAEFSHFFSSARHWHLLAHGCHCDMAPSDAIHTHTHTRIQKETRTYASVRVLSLYEFTAAAAASVPTLVRQLPTPLPLHQAVSLPLPLPLYPVHTQRERAGQVCFCAAWLPCHFKAIFKQIYCH